MSYFKLYYLWFYLWLTLKFMALNQRCWNAGHEFFWPNSRGSKCLTCPTPLFEITFLNNITSHLLKSVKRKINKYYFKSTIRTSANKQVHTPFSPVRPLSSYVKSLKSALKWKCNSAVIHLSHGQSLYHTETITQYVRCSYKSTCPGVAKEMG